MHSRQWNNHRSSKLSGSISSTSLLCKLILLKNLLSIVQSYVRRFRTFIIFYGQAGLPRFTPAYKCHARRPHLHRLTAPRLNCRAHLRCYARRPHLHQRTTSCLTFTSTSDLPCRFYRSRPPGRQHGQTAKSPAPQLQHRSGSSASRRS